jgi:CheY-like chemotaxis protein/HPt (histidine-containing phosphotransfer) domain-containing protein
MRGRAGTADAFRTALIDLRLPGIDGWQLASEVNADTAINGTRLVLLTPFGLSAEEAKMKLLRWFDGYLSKPVKKAALLECLFRLSHLDAELEEAEEALEVSPGEEAVPPAADGVRILLAEDNAVNQELFATMVRKLGYDLEIASDGREAVDKAKSGRFDLIFMDVQMPVLNGLEAAAEIRAAGIRAPIVAVTASVRKDERVKCRESGMDDFLSKPFRKQELAAALSKWLSAGRTARGGPGPSGRGADASVFDHRAALAAFLGEEKVLRRVLSGFLSKVEGHIPLIARALEEEDHETVRLEAHGIKGSALNLTARALGKAAERLEEAGRRKDARAGRECFRDMASAFRALKEAVGSSGLLAEKLTPQ